MRKFIRDQIIEILNTLKEGVIYAEKSSDLAIRLQLLEDCQRGCTSVFQALQDGFSPTGFAQYEEIFSQLEAQTETMKEQSKNGEKTDKVHRQMRKSLEKMAKELKNDPEVRLEVVFMPYKLSMWDSLESIWREAKEDERCDCYVMPIPYFERDKQKNLSQEVYEGNDFPESVPVVHYNDYDIANRKPDIIYIHNPYDENNIVTSVHPDYYSYNLKKHTQTLVYVPYCIHTSIKDQSFSCHNYANITRFADFAICQNQREKDIYAKNGINAQKILPLGSPKLDDVFYMNEHPPQIPMAWQEKIKDKKVILFNLSINYVLQQDIDYIYWLFEQILANKDIVLLYRPHPLLEATFQSMRPGMYQKYTQVLHQLESSENVIIDREKEVYSAFYCSNAMISVQSSLIHNYMLTGKPIFYLKMNPMRYDFWTGKFPENAFLFDETKAYYPKCEHSSQLINIELNEAWEKKIKATYPEELAKKVIATHYEFAQTINGTLYSDRVRVTVERFGYNDGSGGIQPYGIAEFLELVKEGKDPLKEERLSAFQKSAVHCDGKNGANIHKEILKRFKY